LMLRPGICYLYISSESSQNSFQFCKNWIFEW
jgi:hypothetical protein